MRDTGPDESLQTKAREILDNLATLLAASPNAVIVVDESGVIVLADAAVKALFGFDPDEVVGQSIEMLVPEQLRAVHRGSQAGFHRIRHGPADGTWSRALGSQA